MNKNIRPKFYQFSFAESFFSIQACVKLGILYKKRQNVTTIKIFTIFYMMYINKKLYLTVHTIHSIQTIRCICVRKIYSKVYFSTCVICMFFFRKWKCRISSRCILDKFPQTSSNHYLSVRFVRRYSMVISLR